MVVAKAVELWLRRRVIKKSVGQCWAENSPAELVVQVLNLLQQEQPMPGLELLQGVLPGVSVLREECSKEGVLFLLKLLGGQEVQIVTPVPGWEGSLGGKVDFGFGDDALRRLAH